MKFRLMQTLIAFDQLLNALLCGGYADETMSANAYRMEQAGKPWGFMRRVIDGIFFWQPLHCLMSYESERQRSQSPPEERTSPTSNNQ